MSKKAAGIIALVGAGAAAIFGIANLLKKGDNGDCADEADFDECDEDGDVDSDVTED